MLFTDEYFKILNIYYIFMNDLFHNFNFSWSYKIRFVTTLLLLLTLIHEKHFYVESVLVVMEKL